MFIQIRFMAVLPLAAFMQLHAAPAPGVVRMERAALVSKPKGDWIDYGVDNGPISCYFRLRFKIDAAGKVTDVEVADRGFSAKWQIAAATSYVKGYKFKPATRNGVPIESRVAQAFAVSDGELPAVSPLFREESKKVVALISAGDIAGASFHAEYMLSEVVRSRAEYLGLQGTMGQAYASAGNTHRALAALRSATVRVKAAPKFELDGPVPRNDASNFQFNNRDYMASLLDLRFRLAAKQGYFMEALWVYRELAGLVTIAPDDPRAQLAGQMTAALRSPRPLIARVTLDPDAGDQESGWNHALYRRDFTFDEVKGEIRRILLVCQDESREISYAEDMEWSVPAGWEECNMTIYGEPGSSFQIVEFSDAAPDSGDASNVGR